MSPSRNEQRAEQLRKVVAGLVHSSKAPVGSFMVTDVVVLGRIGLEDGRTLMTVSSTLDDDPVLALGMLQSEVLRVQRQLVAAHESTTWGNVDDDFDGGSPDA